MGALISKLIGDEYDHQTVGSQTQEVMTALMKAYPQLQTLINAGKTDAAQGDLAAARATTGGFNDLALSELERTQPAVTRIQGAADAGQAANDVANLNKYGVQAGQAMRATDASANPEFYKNLEDLGAKYTQLLEATHPSMSAGQRSEMERGLARSNPGMADNSAVNLAEKASAYGEAGQKQLANFSNIVNGVAAHLPALKSGLSPVNLALGRDSRSSDVAGAVKPVVLPTGEATTTGTGLFGQMAGTQADINKMRAGAFKTWGDAMLQDSQSFANIASGVGGIAGAA